MTISRMVGVTVLVMLCMCALRAHEVPAPIVNISGSIKAGIKASDGRIYLVGQSLQVNGAALGTTGVSIDPVTGAATAWPVLPEGISNSVDFMREVAGGILVKTSTSTPRKYALGTGSLLADIAAPGTTYGMYTVKIIGVCGGRLIAMAVDNHFGSGDPTLGEIEIYDSVAHTYSYSHFAYFDGTVWRPFGEGAYAGAPAGGMNPYVPATAVANDAGVYISGVASYAGVPSPGQSLLSTSNAVMGIPLPFADLRSVYATNSKYYVADWLSGESYALSHWRSVDGAGVQDRGVVTQDMDAAYGPKAMSLTINDGAFVPQEVGPGIVWFGGERVDFSSGVLEYATNVTNGWLIADGTFVLPQYADRIQFGKYIGTQWLPDDAPFSAVGLFLASRNVNRLPYALNGAVVPANAYTQSDNSVILKADLSGLFREFDQDPMTISSVGFYGIPPTGWTLVRTGADQTDAFGQIQLAASQASAGQRSFQLVINAVDAHGASTYPSNTVIVSVLVDKSVDGAQDDDCSGCTQPLLGVTAGSMTAPPSESAFSGDPIRYADGEMQMWEDDLEPLASGSLSYRRSYSNLLILQSGDLGVGWLCGAQPRLHLRDDYIVMRRRAETQVSFKIQGPDYVRLRPGYSKLVSGQNGNLVYIDSFGGMSVFQGFAETVPVAQRGSIIRQYNQAGMLIVTNYHANGRLAETRRVVHDGRHEILTYDYGANGLVRHVERRQAIPGGSDSTLIQAVDYTYYTGAVNDFGAVNQMRSAVVSSGTGQVLRQFHYRYYLAGEPLGFPTAMKLAIGPRNYARLIQAGEDPLSMSTTLLTGAGTHVDKVDKYFEYDTSGRVKKQILKTSDVDGSGTFSYDYFSRTSPPATPLPNDWLMQTIETNPDGSQNIVYTNKNGDILVKARRATPTALASGWLVDAYRFDDNWRMTWHITPAAMVMSGGKWYNDALGSDLGIYAADSPYVNNTVGLIERWTYYPSGVPEEGRVQYEQQQIGEAGALINMKSYTYLGHSR